jgi:hypothetical protein
VGLIDSKLKGFAVAKWVGAGRARPFKIDLGLIYCGQWTTVTEASTSAVRCRIVMIPPVTMIRMLIFLSFSSTHLLAPCYPTNGLLFTYPLFPLFIY